MEREIIRHLRTTEIPNVVELHKSCISVSNAKFYTPKQIAEWQNQISAQNIQDQLNNSEWIVLLNNEDNLIGFAQYSLKSKELLQIQIAPEEQNRGNGKTLFKYIIEDFKANYINKMKLFSTINAVPFYLSLGFIKIKEISFPLKKENIKMIEMEKSLN